MSWWEALACVALAKGAVQVLEHRSVGSPLCRRVLYCELCCAGFSCVGGALKPQRCILQACEVRMMTCRSIQLVHGSICSFPETPIITTPTGKVRANHPTSCYIQKHGDSFFRKGRPN